MLFSLVHAFLLFFCVVVLARMMMPARYVLLNPYAATLDNLLARLLKVLQTAMPLPIKPLCGVLLALALSADAVMLSRMGQSAVAINTHLVFVLPAVTFKQWLLIAVLGLFRHLLMILATLLVLQIWHRSRTFPGYSGDLLRLALPPITRAPLVLQWGVLLSGACLLSCLLMYHAEAVHYPIEALKKMSGVWGQVADFATLSTWPIGLRLAAATGLMVLDVLPEIHGFVVTLILFSILCAITRNQGLTYFINDLFRLLKGPLPELRFGFLNLTPVLILIVVSLASGVCTALFLTVLKGIAHVV